MITASDHLDTVVVDAVIKFPSGLIVSWREKVLGTIKMGDVNVIGDVGARIELESSFDVADVQLLTDFTKVRAL